MAGGDWVGDVGSTTCAFGVRGGVVRRGGCPKCPSLGDGHFGHLRFKFFLKIDFDGHLVGGDFALFGGCCWEWKRVKNDVHSH